MIFDKLKGIGKERKILKRISPELEKLVDLSNFFVENYADKITVAIERATLPSGPIYAGNEMYLLMHKELEKKMDFDYNEKDIADFVLAKSNQDFYAENAAKALGLFSGNLVHLLTNRNKEKEKPTKIYVNGRGNRFDCLFYYAKNVDELIVENFAGHSILYCAGSFEGEIKKIVAKDIKDSDYLGALVGYKGKIGTIILKDIVGSYVGTKIENTDLVIIKNVDGNNTGEDIGGDIGTIIIKNCKGDNIGKEIGSLEPWSGIHDTQIINFVIIKDIIGNYVAGKIGVGSSGFNTGHKGKIINLIVVENIESNSTCSGLGKYGLTIKNLLLNNIKGENKIEDIVADKIVFRNKARKEYDQIKEQYHINEALSLVDSMEGKSAEELVKIGEEIKNISKKYEKGLRQELDIKRRKDEAIEEIKTLAPTLSEKKSKKEVMYITKSISDLLEKLKKLY